MEGATATLPTPTRRATRHMPTRPAASRGIGRDLGLLIVLLLLAAGARAWLIDHTEVAARDSIGFIRYVLQLEARSWPDVIHDSSQHPGYPLCLMVVSWPVRYFLGATDSYAMTLSAQLTSALAGVLLVIPMFYLGKEVFGRTAGFWGAALFQCLPVSGRILSDGLSEATFLLFAASAMVLGVRALRRNTPLSYALCGLFVGLSYLTRPEGVLVAAVVGLILLARQVTSVWRQPWSRVVACGASLVVTAAVIGSPYFLVTGRFTNKPTGQELLKTIVWQEEVPENRTQIVPAHGPVLASILAVWSLDYQKGSALWGLWAVVFEAIKAYYYLLWLPGLFGMWWYRDRFRITPGSWVLLLTCVLQLLLVWRLAVVGGYVSERHLLLVVLSGSFAVVAGLAEIGSMLGARLATGRRWTPVLLLSVVTLCGLISSMRPMHINRAGFRQAGLWLFDHSTPADPILDPFCWTHYYAGRLFWEEVHYEPPPGYHPTYYVVLERSNPEKMAARSKHNLLAQVLPAIMVERSNEEHARLPLIKQAQEAAARGSIAYHWPEEESVERAKVLVYAVPMQ